MFPRYKMARQKGSMLVIAIFVIVVMSLLGLAMTRILSASSNTIVYEVYGLRALQAARSGIEANIAKVFPVPKSDPEVAGPCGPLLSNVEFSAVPGFENCNYSATCDATLYGDGTHTLYKFASIGKCTAGDISVSRMVKVEAKL
jgi:MSHA biogenesis protein MshP